MEEDFEYTFKIKLSPNAVKEFSDESGIITNVEGTITHSGCGHSGTNGMWDTDSSKVLINGKEEDDLSDEEYDSMGYETWEYIHMKAMGLEMEDMAEAQKNGTTVIILADDENQE